MVISVEEYRKILNDYTTPDERIKERVEYLEALCRNVARREIETYVKGYKTRKKEQLAHA